MEKICKVKGNEALKTCHNVIDFDKVKDNKRYCTPEFINYMIRQGKEEYGFA